MRFVLLFLLAVIPAAAETSFEAAWKKPLLRDKDGVLSVSERGIGFQLRGADKPERFWTFVDIKHFDRLSATEVEISSYLDAGWKLGADRRYRFVLKQGEFSDALHAEVVSRIGKPATDRVTEIPEGVQLELPAKHLKRRGSSQGTLYFTPGWIVYSTTTPKRSRAWRLDRDVDTVFSSDPFGFEVHVFDGASGVVRQPTVYRFALKLPLEATFYRRLKLQLYELGREQARLR